MVNRVILVGNLTRDAESVTGSRGAVTRMRLATSTQWRDADGNRQEATEFHNMVAFGRLAEICGQYCLRGRRIYVEGRLRTRDYDGPDGLRRTSTEVVVDTMRLLDRREHEETDLVPPGAGVSPIPAGSPATTAEAAGLRVVDDETPDDPHRPTPRGRKGAEAALSGAASH